MRYTIDNHKHIFSRPGAMYALECELCGLLKSTIDAHSEKTNNIVSEEPKQKACDCQCHCTGLGDLDIERCQYMYKDGHPHIECEHCRPTPSLNTWEKDIKIIIKKHFYINETFPLPGDQVNKTLLKDINDLISLAIQKEGEWSKQRINKLKEKEDLIYNYSEGVAVGDAESVAYINALDDALAIISNKGVEEK